LAIEEVIGLTFVLFEGFPNFRVLRFLRSFGQHLEDNVLGAQHVFEFVNKQLTRFDTCHHCSPLVSRSSEIAGG
jgi:hypothetical protein